MKRIQLLSLLLITCLSVLAQSNDEPAFTNTHRSTTIFYGVSALFGGGAYTKDGSGGKSFTAGPLSFSFNKALNDYLSFNWGPSFMYYRFKPSTPTGTEGTDAAQHIFGGLTFGLNYHVTATSKIDPYIGGSLGVGYYHQLGESTTYNLDGSIPLLYGIKAGVNAYTKANRAWTIELGYDYLSYLKVGYTFVKSK